MLPTLSNLDYGQLDGVQDGGLAQDAYLKAIDKTCTESEKNLIRNQLLAYCKMDTLAMVNVWSEFWKFISRN